MVGLSYIPVQVMILWNYREIGALSVTSNTIQRYIGTVPTGSVPYVNVGVSVADPVAWGISYTYSPLNCNVTGNSISEVYNGVYVANMSKAPVGIASNTVTMMREPTIYTTQKGIGAVQNLFLASITQNSVVGLSTIKLYDSMRTIWTNHNFSLSVRCNTTANSGRAIEFNKLQPTDFVEDNQMKNHLKGLVLDNSSVLCPSISALGNSTWPTNNVWNGTWSSPNYMTYTDHGSSAQYGKLYIKYGGASIDPDGFSATTGSTVNPAALYFHTTYLGSVTLLSSSSSTSGCRIGSGSGSGTGVMQRLLELAVKDSIDYPLNTSENQYMDKVFAYRSICSNTDLVNSASTTTYLSTWYTNAQSSIQDTMYKIEGCLANGRVDSARTMINAWTPANNIESTYHDFYNVYANIKDSTYTTTDSTTLVTLANSCPYVYGMGVYQARALYNIYYDGFYPFFNNCGTDGSGQSQGSDARGIAPKESRKEISVQLKSEIYPNPNDGNYTLRINRTGEKSSVEITIFDITGRLVLKEQRNLADSSEFKIKNDLQNGMYLVKVKFDDGTYDIHHLIISK